jgi:hypothetical protein
MGHLKIVLLGSILFFSTVRAESTFQHLFCQFWSSSTYSPVVINLKNDFEALQTEIQSCVYQDAQGPGIDQVGLCLKFTREGVEQSQATELQADLISGNRGIYRTHRTLKLDLKTAYTENFIVTADYENDLFASGLCSFQK